MLYEVKSWRSGKVIATKEADSLKGALELLVRGVVRGVLSDAVLSDADLSGADLSGADLSGAVLSGAVLSGADMSGAVLSGAVLSGAVLSGADMSGKEFYTVPHLHNKMLEAVGASENPSGGLDMGKWHTCETTHCRAGWAIHLAGNAGRLLESIHGSELAGALIHQASCPWLEKVPNFYAGNEEALADIKACAEREKAEAAK